jgi:hypothetical protein
MPSPGVQRGDVSIGRGGANQDVDPFAELSAIEAQNRATTDRTQDPSAVPTDADIIAAALGPRDNTDLEASYPTAAGNAYSKLNAEVPRPQGIGPEPGSQTGGVDSQVAYNEASKSYYGHPPNNAGVSRDFTGLGKQTKDFIDAAKGKEPNLGDKFGDWFEQKSMYGAPIRALQNVFPQAHLDRTDHPGHAAFPPGTKAGDPGVYGMLDLPFVGEVPYGPGVGPANASGASRVPEDVSAGGEDWANRMNPGSSYYFGSTYWLRDKHDWAKNLPEEILQAAIQDGEVYRALIELGETVGEEGILEMWAGVLDAG